MGLKGFRDLLGTWVDRRIYVFELLKAELIRNAVSGTFECFINIRELFRDDIVGQRIKQVWRSPWRIEYEKYHYSDTFVELENGVSFLLVRQNPLEKLPIYSAELNKSELIAEVSARLPPKTPQYAKSWVLKAVRRRFWFWQIRFFCTLTCMILTASDR